MDVPSLLWRRLRSQATLQRRKRLLFETLHTSEAEETAKSEGGVGTTYERPQTEGRHT